MPKASNNVKEQLQTLEKIVKKILRKSLKDNTLDYTVQITTSSLEPGKIKYAAQISAPAKGVQPITFIYDNYEMLKASLEESEKELSKKKVEITFHQSRINSYNNKVKQHEERMKQLEDPEYEEDEDIPMEEITL